MKKKYKAILFDLFHTLLSLTHSKVPGNHTSSILNIPKDRWNYALFSESDKRLRGEITNTIDIISDIVKKINPNISSKKIERAAKSREERFKHLFLNIPTNTISTLQNLKNIGYKLGLISNADKMECSFWELTEFSPLFDSVIFSCNVGYVKPEKKIYKLSLEDLEIFPKEALFVGDGNCDELIGATSAGIDTVFTSEYIKDLYPQKVSDRIKISDYHIDNINQLLDINTKIL